MGVRMRHIFTIVLALSACSPDDTKKDVCTTPPCNQEVAIIPLEPSRDIDILFMIDNSGAMAEEQAALIASFPQFINVLSDTEAGLPNLHIGVVSSDVGAGNFSLGSCEGSGDNGALQHTPAGNCSPPDDAYIIDLDNGGGSRTRNYQGELADTFSCIAQLGISGCSFEQPLESLKRALQSSNTDNAGFLRDDAWLVLILLTNEDDCSASVPELFGDEDGPLGPLASFRCFESGVVCDDDQPRTLGVKTGCQSRENSTYLRSIAEYASFFKGLKSDPSDVIIAGIMGNPTPVTVIRGTDDNPRLDASCASPVAGEATPAVRIASFLSSFPARNVSTTICNDDLSDALTVIGELVTTALGSPCLQGTIAMPLDCTVEDVRYHGQSNEMRSELAQCDSATSPTNQPCYVITADLEQCSTTPSGLSVEVHRTQSPPSPSDTSIVVSCKA